jgi:tight adherence protein C
VFITLFAGLLFVGLATVLGARALSFNRSQAVARLRSIEMYGFAVAPDVEAGSESNNLNRIAERIGTAMAPRMKSVDLARMRRDLLGAGYYSVTAEAYLGYRLIVAGMTSCALLLIAIGSPGLLTIAALLLGGLLAWRIPLVVVQRRARERCGQIDRDLPELIDLLVVSVEAGVGLGGALQMIATRITGPLGDELSLMLQEQSMGLSNDQSLTKLLDRVDTPSVRSFVRSLQQGERLGVSIGTILRNLAVEMRVRRRQTAEEQAQKAPVKILFPLIFLIFPAMLIVLAYPIIHAVKEAFG